MKPPPIPCGLTGYRLPQEAPHGPVSVAASIMARAGAEGRQRALQALREAVHDELRAAVGR